MMRSQRLILGIGLVALVATSSAVAAMPASKAKLTAKAKTIDTVSANLNHPGIGWNKPSLPANVAKDGDKVRDQFQTVAKVVGYRDEEILVGHPIHAGNADMLKLLHVRTVTSEKQIGPNTIYQDRYYQAYRIAKNGPTKTMVTNRIGHDAGLQFVRAQNGTLFVTDLKEPTIGTSHTLPAANTLPRITAPRR
jgi:hypothetical protein